MKIKLPTPKQIWTTFINPWFFMIAGVICVLLMGLDYAMHKNCDLIEIWSCLSFVGRFFEIAFLILIPGNVLIRIVVAIINSIHQPRTFL